MGTVTTKQIDRLVAKLSEKLGKKRDETRAILGELSSLVDSFETADEDVSETLRLLAKARDTLEYATDKMSEYA